MALLRRCFSSPVGTLTAVASERGLVALLWENDDPKRVPLEERVLEERIEEGEHPVLAQTGAELAEYFAGARSEFSVPLDLRGTVFQRQVWRALQGIPFGETRSYGQLADELGSPGAARAVGAANGRNPVSIVVPCHRVVGASGKLTGFAGGLSAKAYLLAHEGRDSLKLFAGELKA